MALHGIEKRLYENLGHSQIHPNTVEAFLFRLQEENIRDAVDWLIFEQNDPKVLAEVFAATLNISVFDPAACEIHRRGEGWILSADGVLFQRNPFDRAQSENLGNEMGSLITDLGVLPFDLANFGQSIDEDENVQIDDEANLDDIIDKIIRKAINEGSSDIHLRALETEARVRIRRDGALVDIKSFSLQGNFYRRLINRLFRRALIDANNINEPQDSQFQFRYRGTNIPIRLASIPTTVLGNLNPRVSLRLLASANTLRKIDTLGFPDTAHNPQLSNIRAMTRRPNGIVLVTGPTGSGKTTTLYAMINKMMQDSPDLAYFSLDDPIEIEVPGVDQAQINPEAGLTFAAGLRSLMRLDPDRILLGEIRDEETMENAIRLGLTGHLILSTLHSNSAFMAIERMKDMGANGANLANTLVGIISQRVIRKVCPKCSIEISWNQLVTLDHPSLKKMPQELAKAHTNAAHLFDDLPMAPTAEDRVRIAGAGCDYCRNQGHIGRQIVAETVFFDRTLREMISLGAPTQQMIEHAQEHRHFVEIWGHALQCILSGQITFDSALAILEERDPLTPKHVTPKTAQASEAVADPTAAPETV